MRTTTIITIAGTAITIVIATSGGGLVKAV
jgi:hypothetical protein